MILTQLRALTIITHGRQGGADAIIIGATVAATTNMAVVIVADDKQRKLKLPKYPFKIIYVSVCKNNVH